MKNQRFVQRSIRTRTLRGRPSKITRERVDKLCDALAMGADLTCACDFNQISRKTPALWEEKGRQIEELIAEEIAAGKQTVITEEDRLYLEFYSRIKSASASFKLRQHAIMNAAGGSADPRTGRIKVGDWRAAESLLKMVHPLQYGSVKDIPLRVDPIGVDTLGADEDGQVEIGNLATGDLFQYVYEQEILSQRTERTEPLKQYEPAPQPEPPEPRSQQRDIDHHEIDIEPNESDSTEFDADDIL